MPERSIAARQSLEKTFMLHCHFIIMIDSFNHFYNIFFIVSRGEFVCTVCSGDKPVEAEEVSSSGKRKGGMSDQDVTVCERILLELFCHPSSVPFQEPVNKAVSHAYTCIII